MVLGSVHFPSKSSEVCCAAVAILDRIDATVVAEVWG